MEYRDELELPKLYEITSDLRDITHELQENGGELTEELAARLDAAEGQFAAKAERVLYAIRNLESEEAVLRAQADVFAEEARRYAERAKARSSASTGLKRYLLRQITLAGESSIETGAGKITIVTPSTPSVEWIGPPESIPEQLRRVVTPELDKKAAAASIATLIATQSEEAVSEAGTFIPIMTDGSGLRARIRRYLRIT